MYGMDFQSYFCDIHLHEKNFKVDNACQEKVL